MAQVSSVASDDASDNVKTRNKSPTKAKKDESEVEDSEVQSEVEDGGDGDEEEYEIEAILDAKKGQFEKNKLGYFVKWKGYSDEHNSWVTEEDAGNATDLISAFWAERKKKEAPRKAPESVSKRPRKSVGVNESDVGESASAPVAKKRARKSESVKATEKDDDERPAKKPRKPTERKTASAARNTSADLLNDDEVGNMAEHMHAPSWDQLIKQIDTVERLDDKLYVYFTLNNGDRIREDSETCADKFPKMLISFYESNLRWKEADH